MDRLTWAHESRGSVGSDGGDGGGADHLFMPGGSPLLDGSWRDCCYEDLLLCEPVTMGTCFYGDTSLEVISFNFSTRRFFNS